MVLFKKIHILVLLVLLIISCARNNPDQLDGKRFKPIDKARTLENWIKIARVSEDNNYEVFVDPRSIKDVDGYIRSWSKLFFEKRQTDIDGLEFDEVRIYSSIHCIQKQYSYISSRFFNSHGELVFSEEVPTGFNKIKDNTVSSMIQEYVCNYKIGETK